MRYEVFVSYKTEDSKYAMEIVEHLEKADISCFVAPRNIESGTSYASNITRAIAECDTAVLVCSSNINGSDHVLNEIDLIINARKKLIPFFTEEFEMNDDLKYYLGRQQRILAYGEDKGPYYQKLAETIAPGKAIKLAEKAAEKEAAKTADQEEDVRVVSKTQTTIFEYLPSRGIMINPEDRQRNVSFRTDTLINLFSRIYEDVSKMIGEEEIGRIFFDAGYSAGLNFAQRLGAQWENQNLTIQEKLNKWCEFDSNVGWGKFTINMNIDEENGELDGLLKINENFLVDRRSKCKICNFVHGYCDAIIESLCGDIRVDLDCIECPMTNKFKTACVFHIKMTEEM